MIERIREISKEARKIDCFIKNASYYQNNNNKNKNNKKYFCVL